MPFYHILATKCGVYTTVFTIEGENTDRKCSNKVAALNYPNSDRAQPFWCFIFNRRAFPVKKKLFLCVLRTPAWFLFCRFHPSHLPYAIDTILSKHCKIDVFRKRINKVKKRKRNTSLTSKVFHYSQFPRTGPDIYHATSNKVNIPLKRYKNSYS